MRLLVIGGGAAGVATATRLLAAGAHVTLVDEHSSLGGRARSELLDGMQVDTGAQLIASSFSRTLRLLGAAAGELRRSPGRDAMMMDGRRVPIQFGSALTLLGFGGLGAMEKLRLGRHLLPLLARHGSDLDASGSRLPASLDRQSARGFVAAHVGNRAADVLVEPPLAPFYAASGAETSLAFFLALARYGSESQLLAPPAGWSELWTAAADGAEIVRETRIVELERASDGIGMRAAAADGRRWMADGIAIATDPHAAASLLSALLPAQSPPVTWLAGVSLRPTFTLALSVRGALDRSAFGVFPLPRAARLVSACAVYGAKLGTAASADRDVVLAWPTPAAVPALLERDAESVAEAMFPEVERLVPGVRGRAEAAFVYRHVPGTPHAAPGSGARLAQGATLSAALPLPVALAGDYLSLPTIEGAVWSGTRAAEQLLARLGGGER